MSKDRLDYTRKPSQIRPISFAFNTQHNAAGSLTFSMGETKILCSVFGPVQLEHQTLTSYFSQLPSCSNETFTIPKVAVVFHHAIGSYATFTSNNVQITSGVVYPSSATTEDQTQKTPKPTYLQSWQHHELLLQNALQQIIAPQPEYSVGCGITISLKVIQDDGSVLSSAFNAAVLGLIHAGIALKTIFCSLNVGFLNIEGKEQPTLVVDPNKDEELGCKGWAFFVFDVGQLSLLKEQMQQNASPGRNVTFYMNGELSDSEYLSCLKTARSGCTETLLPIFRTALNKISSINPY